MQMIYSPSAVFGKKLENLDFKIVDDPTEWFAKGWRTYEQYRNGVEPKAEEPVVEETTFNSAPVETEEAPKRRGRNRRGV